jgi:hypothetical protein
MCSPTANKRDRIDRIDAHNAMSCRNHRRLEENGMQIRKFAALFTLAFTLAAGVLVFAKG